MGDFTPRNELFNGLMLNGSEIVNIIYLSNDHEAIHLAIATW